MLTFTLPQELRSFCRSNQRVAYGALFTAAAESIKKLACDPRHIGCDLPGFTGVLHTWGRQLQYHPHVHFIVPAGGLSKNRDKWLPAGNAFYLPVRALSKIFKAKFKAEMAKSGLLTAIDPKAWQVSWNVNCQSVGDSEASYKYLAPYIFRVAIADSRIVAMQGREVTFSYRKSGSKRLRKITLDAIEFIRRYLQHVLPLGFVKVRHFGFMSSGCNVSLHWLRLCIVSALQKISSLSEIIEPRKKRSVSRPFCRSCGAQLLYLFSMIPGAPCRGST